MKKIIFCTFLLALAACGKEKCDCLAPFVGFTSKQDYIIVPSAFTPNGDNINDMLFVKADSLSTIKFSITKGTFSTKIFETTNSQSGWDGNHNGEPADEGTYNFTLEAKTAGGQSYTKQGEIRLIRHPENCCPDDMGSCTFGNQYDPGSGTGNALLPSGETFSCKK